MKSRGWVYQSLAVAGLLLSSACMRQGGGLPQVGTEQYGKLCSAFYLGLAALQSGEDVNARKGLSDATQIAPDEPASWLNLALLDFRQQDFEGAYQSASTALKLVAGNSRVEALLGMIESKRGKVPEAIGHLERAVQLDSRNLKAAYALAQETERQNSDATDAKAQQLFERILTVQPNNIAVLIEDIRLAAKRNDSGRLRRALESLQQESSTWPAPAKEQLATLEQTAKGDNVRAAAMQVQFLKNVLVRAPAYRQSLDEVRTPATSAGEPFLRFFKLPSPPSEPDPPDFKLSFAENVPDSAAGDAIWAGAVALDGDSKPVSLWTDGVSAHLSNGASLPLPDASKDAKTRLGPHWIAAADLDYDFKVDLTFATASGLKFFRQIDGQHFGDVTRQTKLPGEILAASYSGVWAFDYDLDGDLDLVLGAPSGTPVVLRNNGDGTFTPVHPFAGVDGLLDFACADVDGDGDPDVAIIDAGGKLIAFSNERLGDYRKRDVPQAVSMSAAALAAADVNGDGLPDFVVLQRDGKIVSLSDHGAGATWTSAVLAQAQSADAERGTLFLADLDNNGALDLVTGSTIFLSDGKQFTKWTGKSPGVYIAAADMDDDGLIDLVGLRDAATSPSQPQIWKAEATSNYHWQTVKPKAAHTAGDQRINSFGIGGEIEIRADLLTQKQVIASPQMHFGMGSHRNGTQFARIGWPNGLIQTEFNLKPDQTLIAEQRLKGSCPYLFAWNGSKIEFVKDVAPMAGALGAHDPAGNFAPASQTRQWFSLSGAQLQPRDGVYDLRVTDEYWETYYIDQYQLLAVDHPVGTSLFIDERVAVPAAPLRPYLTRQPHPFTAALDEGGTDVSRMVRDLDGIYLDTFRPAVYQGIAQDHYVDLLLPDSAPSSGPLYLIAEGWLHPWDDSTLVAVNQGSTTKPRDLTLEVRDESHGWRIARSNLGVPAGRRKSIVLPLAGLFDAHAKVRRLRLRTNLEIYWDRLQWAEGLPRSLAHTAEAPLESATLRHRGFSSVAGEIRTSPEIPSYEMVAKSDGKWRSLAGYYTRYGDVAPLLAKPDGRFTIVNSGDELRLRFSGLPGPLPNQVRDYIFVGDGWLKEGDFSFNGSNSVLPLPNRSSTKYDGASKSLESDPAYRQHPDDWRLFHTRYVDGEHFGSGLWQ